MTAKEFVKQHYPKAYALKCVRSGFNSGYYYLIFKERGSNYRLADGDDNKPESAAWVKAKKGILETCNTPKNS
jgi:hypothetical protein